MRWTAVKYMVPILGLAVLSAPLLRGQDPVSKAIEAQTPKPVVIWHETVDVPQLNLIYGAGGKEDAPTPGAKYKFRKEDSSGTNPKFDVEDDSGIRWRVKLGPEPRAETAATRLLFAAGYFVDEDYYIENLPVEGLPKLHKGKSFVTDGNIVHGARLERRTKEVKKLGNLGVDQKSIRRHQGIERSAGDDGAGE